MNPRSSPKRRQVVKIALGLAGWLAAIGVVDAVRADSPPEVARVRVPSARVSAYFPPRTTLRTLTFEQFEALVAAAEAGAREPSRAGTAAPLRPVRVEHQARWDGSALVGRSFFTLPATAAEPAVVLCDPWSPFLAEAEAGSDLARVDRAGRLILVQQANQPTRVVEVPWRQVSQPDSDGRAFGLHLPGAAVGVLTLDLADGVEPIAHAPSAGGRRGPSPAATAGRSCWEFAGATGPFPIQLLHPDPAAPPRPGGPDRLWVGGPTRVDFQAPAANWVADWKLESSVGSPPTLQVDLDPGLELIDVSGPDVVGFHLEPAASNQARVAVMLGDAGSNRTRSGSIQIQARVQPPVSGPWLVPSAHPVNAGWMGGRTEIRLDPARVVASCAERAGRRVPARLGEVDSSATWIFESDQRPGPLAEFRFRPPAADAAVEIQGTLRVGSFVPKVEVAATWTLSRGRLLDPTLDLPAGWVVDRVSGGNGRPDVAFQVEPLAEGDRRIHFNRLGWTGDASAQVASLVVLATRAVPDPNRPVRSMPLPRMRPPAAGPVRVADERWVAEVEPGWSLVPTEHRGLAWFDPAEATGGLESSGPGSPQQLAWRWAADDASASVLWTRDRPSPRLAERLEAAIVADRLRLAWTWTVAEAGRPDALIFHLPLDARWLPRWRSVGASGSGGGPVVEPRPVDPARRQSLGLPATGTVWELILNPLPPGPLVLRGEAEIPWGGTGSIPRARIVAVNPTRSIVVRVEDAVRFRVERSGGWNPVAEGTITDPKASGPDPEPSPYRSIVGDDQPGLRVAGAWVGEGDPGPVDVATIAAPLAAGPPGVITEASLISRVVPGSDSRHRLSLRIVPAQARTIDLTLPPGATLDRVRRDGQSIAGAMEGALLRVDLSLTEPARTTSTITLDYRTGTIKNLRRVHPATLLPRSPLPCLSFTWQVNTPEQFRVSSESPDLIDTTIGSRYGAMVAPGEEADLDVRDPMEPVMVADLNRALLVAPPVETTLGDWLIKLDAGRWPLVIDRLALQSVGWGPKSRVNVASAGSEPPMTANRAFEALGLTLEPVGATFLISTAADRRIEASTGGRARLGQTLFDVAITGSDRSDRYQSPARWRAEATPRAWLASETPQRGLIAAGWRAHRFTAPTWPDSAMAIRVADARTVWREVALAAAGVFALFALVGAVQAMARRVRGRARKAAIGLAGLLVLTCPAWARFDPAEPIIALFPYGDLACVEAVPDRVVLRQDDHDRLIRLARLAEVGATTRADVRAVLHLVAPPGERAVVVESRYHLEVIGPGPVPWSFPVGTGYDLAATVDGQPVPLEIAADGRTATIAALSPGRSLVVFRRSVALVAEAGEVGGSIEVPVDRAALARVEVTRGSWPGSIELPDLAGGSVVRPDGVTGELGPRDRVEVRWGDSRPDRLELAAQVRWDALAAGDRLTARLTVGGKVPLRSVRLALGPGLAVVGQTIPGLVGAAPEGRAGTPGWVAHVDPPLRPGATFEVVLWRPAALAGGTTRTFPRLDLVGGRLAGVVDCRLPEDWSGRLVATPPATVKPPAEVDFARAWGPILPDGLSLRGSAPWDGASRPSLVQLGPDVVRRSVRNQAEVEVVPGSVRFVVEALLVDRVGMTREAEATFPGPVRLSRVEAAGLASWTQVGPDRVRLVFDGSQPSRERSIRLHGTAAIEVEAEAGPGQRVAASIPWPRWTGADHEPGKLTVARIEGFEVRAGDSRVEPDPVRTSSPPSSGRLTYTVPRAESWRLRWVPLSPRVNVAVDSRLLVDAARATWIADVTTEAAGGPVDRLYWKLPTAWAEGATLTSTEAGDPRVEVEVRGDVTFWAITLDQPLWHRRTFRLRSSRPWTAGASIAYPEVAPLSEPGQGAVGRYDLAIANLSGTSILVEESAGVVPQLSLPLGPVGRAFRVAAPAWSVRLRIGAVGDGSAPLPVGQDDSMRPSRVEHVAFQVALDSGAGARGKAECAVEPGSAFLGVMTDGGARLIWASVEGRAVEPIEPGPATLGRWLIPLGDRPARRVQFGWISPPGVVAPGPAGSRSVPLPRFDQPSVPASVQVTSPASAAAVGVEGEGWTRLNSFEAALDRFKLLGDRVIESVGRVAGRDPEPAESAATLDLLVAMALDLRAVNRASRETDPSPRPPVEAWYEVDDRVSVSVTDAGLESLLDEARRRVGIEPSGPESSQFIGVEAGPDTYRIRSVGPVEHFGGRTPADPGFPWGLVVTPRDR